MTVTTSINASLSIASNVNKSQNLGDPTAGNVTLPLSLGAFSQTWNPGSSPSGNDAWSGNVPMTAGTATIDLTSLTQLGLATTVNMTGYKLRYIEVLAPVTNSAAVQIAPGASNGYPSAGTISALSPGDLTAKTTGSAVAVDGTHKTITITGTGTDSLSILMVFGT